MPNLIVDPKNPDSNSFITLDQANAYFDARLHTSAWQNEQDSEIKERALIWASSVLSRSYRWKGQRIAEAQQLAFPRYGLVTDDGYSVDYESIPPVIQHATGELALSLLSANPSGDSPLDTGLKEIKVSSITLKFDKDSILNGSNVDGNGIPETVSQMISIFVEAGLGATGGVIKLKRT
jgi:hypothetical protein